MDPLKGRELVQKCVVLTHAPYPSPGGQIKLLTGMPVRHYRLRTGDHRMVYRIEGDRVIVVRIAHRREAYR
jgi:mRNA-degrading endonuclease RelE of RelBE toxin-antitoxin system